MTKPRKKRVGDILIETGVVSAEDVQRVLAERKKGKKRLGELLVDNGLCSEADIAASLSLQLGVPLVDLKFTAIEPAAIEVIPEKLARRLSIIPLSIEDRTLLVAMSDPMDLAAIQDAQFTSGLTIKTRIATREDVNWAIDKHYRLASAVDDIVKDISSEHSVEVLPETKEDPADLGDLRSESEAAPIVRMVNHIISSAVAQKASDVHIEPTRTDVAVRYRVDGSLRVHTRLPKWVQGAVCSRIKLMSQMDIAEKRVPQDGRVGVMVGGRALDLRTSTLPANYGEKIVIRLLDSQNVPRSVQKLGLDDREGKLLLALVEKPQGIVLVTGPTGSGKTTTLYCCLAHVNSIEKNITTIEDPIEYELEGINQVGVNERAGRSFAAVLPAILRQDPDVVMVGEMRDLATATTAMQASLTGHLVLSTIHTNSSVATITRLRDLGIPSYLIASTISGIVAQRLVRVICPRCRAEVQPSKESLEKLALTERSTEGRSFYEGAGCANCAETGYVGRTGLYEILVFSQRIREYISREATEATIRQLALSEGMKLLVHAGRDKILAGVTSVEEVLRVIQTDESAGTMCSECGEVISPDFASCPACGTRLIEMCRNCKTIVDRSWIHCPYCSSGLTRHEGGEESCREAA